MESSYMEFPEAAGKTVERLRFIHDSAEPPEVDIRFTDGISLSIQLQLAVRAEGELYASGEADARVLRRYPPD